MKKRLAIAIALCSAQAFAQAPYELNAQTVMMGDPNIGDNPGEPITINYGPRNFILGSDLQVAGTAIEVNVPSFELDMNGYALIGGAGACTTSGAPQPTILNCPAATTEHGISVSDIGGSTERAVVKNGRISRFRGDGIRCQSRRCEVEDVIVSKNLGVGLNLGAGEARDVRAIENGDGGILARYIADSGAESNGRRGLAGSIVVDSSSETTLTADSLPAVGVVGTQLNGVWVSQATVGTGAIVAGQIVDSTVIGGAVGINVFSGSAFGNSVQAIGAGAIGIVTTSPNAVRQNVITAIGGATSMSGNPIAGQNICNGVSC